MIFGQTSKERRSTYLQDELEATDDDASLPILLVDEEDTLQLLTVDLSIPVTRQQHFDYLQTLVKHNIQAYSGVPHWNAEFSCMTFCMSVDRVNRIR